MCSASATLCWGTNETFKWIRWEPNWFPSTNQGEFSYIKQLLKVFLIFPLKIIVRLPSQWLVVGIKFGLFGIEESTHFFTVPEGRRLGKLFEELFETDHTFSKYIAIDMFGRNRWDETTWPAIHECATKGMKFIVSSTHLEWTFSIMPLDDVDQVLAKGILSRARLGDFDFQICFHWWLKL